MKLVYFSNSTIPSKAANSIHVMKMCNAFSSQDIDVTLIGKLGELYKIKNNLFEHYGVPKSFKIKLFKNIKLPFSHIFYALNSVICAKKIKPNLTYSRNSYSTLFASLIGLNCIHEAHSPENFTRFSRFIFKQLLKNKNVLKIVVISEALKKIVIKEYGNSNKILVAHDGADINHDENNYDIGFLKTDVAFNVVYVGHLYKGRGIDIIVELAKSFEDINFHVVGGHDKDVSYWKEQTTKLKNIKFYGFVSPAETDNFRKNANVLIAPYQNKVAISGGKGDTSKWMSPLKIFEYMASNVPMISSKIPVLEEVLIHDYNALLCTPDDIKSWKKALKTLKDDPKKAKYLAINSLDAIKKTYSWSARAKFLINNIKCK